MKIGEVWIDLVNLRSETYAADSRIPTMTFGTAEQVRQRFRSARSAELGAVHVEGPWVRSTVAKGILGACQRPGCTGAAADHDAAVLADRLARLPHA